MKPDLATQAIEAERSHIGHEIHDALIPLIFTASATLQNQIELSADDDPARDRLLSANALLTEALQTARSILTQVYPPELDNTVWTQAAKHTVSRVIAPNIQVDWQLSDESYDYSRPIAAAVYRIIVEAARNASRHGEASQIDIVARKDSVKITDNGKGFDPETVGDDRFGIRSMKGRADLVGGSLRVESKKGDSTTIVFELPTATA